MMKWNILVLSLLLSACSGRIEKHYYQLPVAAIESGSMKRLSHQHKLWVEPIVLADYLSGTGIVYQQTDVRYVMAVNSLWASGLDQQLQQTLVVNLNKALPDWLVSAQPRHLGTDTRLGITVTGFHGRYDGNVVISGEWTLDAGNDSLRQAFNLVIPQSEDGYEALVRALAAGWEKEAEEIAKRIRGLKP